MADITSSEGGEGRAARLAAATERAIEAVAAASPGLELSAACEALTGQPWALRTVRYPEWPSVTLHGVPVEQRKWLAVGLRAGFEFAQGEKIETERWRMLQGERDAIGRKLEEALAEMAEQGRVNELAVQAAERCAAERDEARRERDHYWEALDGCLSRLERANVVLEAAVRLDRWWAEHGSVIEPGSARGRLRDAVRAFQRPVEPSGPVRVVSREERQGMGEPADVENATIEAPRLWKTAGARIVRTSVDELANELSKPKRRPLIDRILGRVCRLEARQERLAERVKRLEELAPKVVDDFTPGPGAPVGWVGHVRGGQVQAVTPPKPAGSFSEYVLREEAAAGRIQFGRLPADVEKLQARVEQLETLVGANAVREEGVEPADLLGRVDAMWERFVSALVVTRSSPDVARRERGFRVQGAWRVGTVDDVDGELDVTVPLSHGWAVVGSVHGTSLYAANVRLPKSTAGVVAVTDEALRVLCLALARERSERLRRGRGLVKGWRGDPEEVRLVWDEFLSGHDARLLP